MPDQIHTYQPDTWDILRHCNRHDTVHCCVIFYGKKADCPVCAAERQMAQALHEATEQIVQQKKEIAELREDCLCYEAMKRGVAVRIADLEAELKAKISECETKGAKC